jgi:hypothetical protein
VSAAFLALAHLAQVVPRVDTAGVSVIPGYIQCVSSHRLHFFGLGWLLVHWQQAGDLFGGLARTAVVIVTLFRAGGAGTGVAQPLKAKMRAMAVVPLNVHSCTGGDVHFDRLGIDYGHMDKYMTDKTYLDARGEQMVNFYTAEAALWDKRSLTINLLAIGS